MRAVFRQNNSPADTLASSQDYKKITIGMLFICQVSHTGKEMSNDGFWSD